MPNVLFVTDSLPYPLEHGMSLRAVNLARSLSPGWNAYLAYCEADAVGASGLESLGTFVDMVEMPPLRKPDSPLRLFRLDDRNLHVRFAKELTREVMGTLNTVVRDWSIDVVVGMNFRVSDFVGSLRGPVRVIDECDCRTLTIERAEKRESSDWGLRRRIGHKVTKYRVRRAEGALADISDLVTTVSPADGNRLQDISSPNARIEVVPNGVSPDLLATAPHYDRPARAVSFWGNLDFDVNHEAMRYFYDKIYMPHLAGESIDWHLVGKSPGAEVLAMADRVESLHLPGFVADLPAYLEEFPLMINPMVMGSGLKNKVLEAFCMGLTVVSTSMGVEALDVEDGVHCVIEDDPKCFADAVKDLLDHPDQRRAMAVRARKLVEEKYDWSSIGSHFSGLLAGFIDSGG